MWVMAALLFLQAASNHNDGGMKALEAGNYEAAAAEFRKAIESDPQDYSAHFNLALAASMLRQDDEGIAEYRKTLELKPHLYEAELNLGILLLRQKRPAEAEPLLEDAAGQKPKEFRPQYYVAEAQFALGRMGDAERNYALAASLDPKSAEAELGWGRALAAQGKLDDAAPHYRKAAELDAKDRRWLLELADSYEKARRLEEAVAIYREFPDDSAVQAHVGELMLNGNRYGEAVPRLEAAYAKDPSQPNRVALAMAYLFDKQLAKALPLMEQAAAAEPSNFEIRMMYGRALRDSKQYPAAAAQFAAAVKLKPSEAPAWRDVADMLYLMGDQAWQAAEKASDPAARSAGAENAAGLYQRALGAFEKARDLEGDSPGNCFLRAIILDKLHQWKPALETYERFLTMSQGKNPDQEFQARHRAVTLRNQLKGH